MPAMARPSPKQIASTLLMLTPMSPAVVGSCAEDRMALPMRVRARKR